MKKGKEHLWALVRTVAVLALYWIISIPLYRHFHEVLYRNMVWNVFLAILPLVFALWLEACPKWPAFFKFLIGLGWLAFFPNAPYIITDIIHISGNQFFLNQKEYAALIYSTNMTLWFRIVYIGIGILIGVLAGMQSLRIVHRMLTDFLGPFFSHLALFCICLVSGYAIYLGRFLRLNSWNLLHPNLIFQKMLGADPLFALKFTLLYAFFIYAAYIVYWLFHATERTER